MNAIDLAKTAYGANSAPIRTLRGTEYAVFTRVTQRLKNAESQKKSDVTAMARAIYDNRRLWLALASDVADKDNGLPQTLRAQIFYLNQFVDHHSRKVLSGKASVSALVDINVAVMRGLGREGGK